MKNIQQLVSKYRVIRAVVTIAMVAAIPVPGFGQNATPLTVAGKFRYHAEATYAPMSLLGIAAYAAVLQEADAPTEWRQGAAPYGKRFVSTLAWSGIHNALAFGLDSALHQDPRYTRSRNTGFWRRAGHAVRGTILTHTDRGGETLSTWRLGADYGSAFLSNMWYPDRLNTVRLGFIQGSVTLGFELVGNLGREFLPDIKKKVLHRR
jgi:hypothetical protein